MKFIPSYVLRTYDEKSHSLTETKRVVLYYIQGGYFANANKFYNRYKLEGGKLSFIQLRNSLKKKERRK